MEELDNKSEVVDARLIANAVPIPCMLLDAELRFAFANDAYLQLFDLSGDAIMGASVFDVFTEAPERVDEATQHFEHAFSGESVVLERYLYRLIDEDGVLQPRYWRISLEPFRATGSEVSHILQCVWDVTREVEAEARNAAISEELRHRVLNVFTVIEAMITLCDRPGQSKETYRNELSHRILAMGRTHKALAETHWIGLGLVDILNAELSPFRVEDRSNVVIQGPNVTLTTNAAQDAAMIVHELVTNAAKYGCFSTPEGRLEIDIDVALSGDFVRVTWTESGLTNVTAPKKVGFGSQLTNLIPSLNVDRAFRETGLKATFEIALKLERPKSNVG